MKSKLFLALTLAVAIPAMPVMANQNVINGLDFGPLAKLVGQWESVKTGGVDVSPAKKGSGQEAGTPAVTPFYEKMTFEVAADAVNASDQKLVAMYYKQEVFRKSDDSKFHDQRGYLIYDATNQVVYNSFCVPRTTCVTAESPAGDNMTFTSSKRGIAESDYMLKNASTTTFSMTLNISDDSLTYSQVTGLKIYGKDISHTDSGKLVKVK